MVSLYGALLLIAAAWILLSALRRRPGGGRRQPPGPRPLPLIGNLLQLGALPYRSLAELAKVHGPVMSLRLGYVRVVVVSSPSIAKQVLQTHDQALADRAVPEVMRSLRHCEKSLAWTPPGEYWRRLRRLCNAHVFNPQRLEANQGLRRRKVEELVSFIRELSRGGQAVDVGQAAYTTSLNILSNTLFSTDVAGHGLQRSAEFKELLRNLMVEAGSPNVADYFPALRWLDPQGSRRRTTRYLGRLHKLFDEMIDGKLKSATAKSGEKGEGLLDVLLHSELDRSGIHSLLADLFVAGSDTTATAVEWAMAELLRRPDALRKVTSEVEGSVSGTTRAVSESDVRRMPYLQAVVKETLRLHTPVPFLLPRRASAAVQILAISAGGGGGGEEKITYDVPRGATVLVNAWAIARDPGSWGPRSEEFLPERFLEGGGAGAVDFTGGDMELIPFGAGRRICPGLPLAAKTVPMVLANLLWAFEWGLPEGMAPGDLDMTEANGIAVGKAKPLLALARPRRV